MYNIVIHYCSLIQMLATLYSIHQYMQQVGASFSAALYSAHEFVRLVCEESMLKADF